MTKRYYFPCIIAENKEDGLFYATFPDIDDCFTDGDSFDNAVINAKEVLELVLATYIDNGKPIPKTQKRTNLKFADGEALVYVDAFIPPTLDKIQTQAVKKTVTIPKWLNDEASRRTVNCSQILQAALKDYLQIHSQ